ncbi:TadE/TadG family type IV pilus assembly protein [Cellulomonas carbonis]|uniref:Membrane protein n=1 Tax=Cellulomonas carbonis T26 TaxID=947969 RepID=A0A0A0BU02_9CELL|nr:TadE/TadG family type IV pilus assembly protein [Cellulomonas carbonis]KGM11883.1 membrane protein [Cellulomonas carbonis T26]GGB91498.1 membrane protein [Cellulomonas carbonis]
MTPTTPHRRPVRAHAGDAGSATLEVAILTPALLLLLALVVFAGRVQVAAGAVEHAAAVAAREASLTRTAGAARTAATTAATIDLDGQDLRCATSTVTVDTAGFARPLGSGSHVTATVTCTVSIADLAIPGLPGTRTLTATATSPLDRYRAR